MNKPTLIGIVMLIALGIGVSSAYAISITLGGDVAVTEDLDVTGDLTGPTINAINTSIANAALCPEGNIQHWDKVIFNATLVAQALDIDFNTPQGKTPLIEGRTFDVKVLDDPNQLADLQEKVAQKLNSLGYSKDNALEPFVHDIKWFNIIIVDVEYAIVCVQPGPM